MRKSNLETLSITYFASHQGQIYLHLTLENGEEEEREVTLTAHDEIKPGSVIQKVVAMKTDILQPANVPPTFGLEAPVTFAMLMKSQ